MANTKRFTQGYQTGGTTPYICVQRDADSFFWNGTAFIANSGNPFLVTMSEKYEGFWEYETDAAVWDNGTYNVTIYEGNLDTDAVLSAFSQVINGDTQVGFIEASSITSKNAVTALRTDLQAVLQTLSAQATALGVLSDRIDSLQAVLSRRDYKE